MGTWHRVIVVVLLLGLAACGGGLGPDFEDIDVPDVDPGPVLRSKPSVVVSDGGKATCVWVGDGHVYAERFLPGYGWTDYTRIDNGGPTADAPQTTMAPDGDAMVVWTQDGEVVANCFEVGSGWQGPVVVSADGGAPARTPCVGTADDGEVVVVWEEDGDVVSRCFEPGAGWLAPVPVATPVAPATTPDVSVSADGDAVAVWTEGEGDVLASTMDGTTGTWSPPTPIGTGTQPRVAADDQDGAVVVWTDGDDAEVTVLDPVEGWTAPAPLPLPESHTGRPVREPDVDVDAGGDAVVVVKVEDDILASVQPAGGGFEEARPVMPGVTAGGRPKVAMDDEGNAMAVVRDEFDRVHTTIYRRTYDHWTEPNNEGAGREPVIDSNAAGETISVFVSGGVIGATRVRDLDPTVPIRVSVVIQGDGRVRTEDGAFECIGGAGACDALVPDGTPIRLFAEPDAGFVFSHWQDDATTDPSRVVLLAGSDVTVTAVFVPRP